MDSQCFAPSPVWPLRHRNHLGKYRSTLWEIHPITKIEVFKDNRWVDLDTLP